MKIPTLSYLLFTVCFGSVQGVTVHLPNLDQASTYVPDPGNPLSNSTGGPATSSITDRGGSPNVLRFKTSISAAGNASFFWSAGSHDPSSAPINFIDWAMEIRDPNSGDSDTPITPVIVQGGEFFRLTGGAFRNSGNTSFATQSFTATEANDFESTGGGHPDFSVGGGVIELGYRLSAATGGSTLVRNSDVRNVSVSLDVPPIVVVTSTADNGPGSLRDAIANAASGSMITFAESLSGQTITLEGTQLTIDKSLTISAADLIEGITIDADRESLIMEIQPGFTVALDGLTLTRGRTSGLGGAIFNDHAILNMGGCTLSENSAVRGGGIYSDGSDSGSAALSLSGCTLIGNSATGGTGGGIHSGGRDSGSATLTLNACTLSGNTAYIGGGISSDGDAGRAASTLTSCTFSDNSAMSAGGGISNGGGNHGSAALTLTSCTLSGNSATGAGGGISNDGRNSGNASIALNSCTLTGNFAHGPLGGGGIYSETYTVGAVASLSLTNTILAGNTAPAGPDLRNRGAATYTSLGNNLFSVNGSNPQLAPLGDYGGPTQTTPPLPGSPAIDSAGSTDPGGMDQRGFNRFVGGMLDIGAVEFQGNTTELELAFDEDIDGDGYSVGVEQAIGSDPAVADPGHPSKLRLTGFHSSAHPTFTFGYVNSDIILSLVRSPDLITFDSLIKTSGTDFVSQNAELIMEVDDTPPPAGGQAFYHLVATRP